MASLGFGCGAHAQSLLDLYRAADAADPAVAGARAQHRASMERENQARSGFGPTANFTASSSHSEYVEPTSLFSPDPRRFNTRQATLQINQPLFKPNLLPQLEQAEAQSEQARLQSDQASIEGMQRFVEAAFEMLKARDALQYLRVEQTSTAAQLEQARRSFTVGTVAVTDVRDAQAKADVVAAQVSAAEFDLSLRHQLFLDLVGTETPALLARGLVSDALPPLDMASLTQWMTQAHDGSPSLRQAQWALEAARQEVRKAQMAHAPTLDASYSYIKTSETGSVTSTQPRSAVQNQVGVTLTIPIYATGATQGKVREALALQDKAQADLESARRTLALNVRQSFSAALSAISQARGLSTAVKSQEVALRANQRGYEVGMKVSSEVLAAQSKLFEAQRDLSKARYDAWLAYMKLKGASGQIAEADLSQLDALLAPVDKPIAMSDAILHPTPVPTLKLRLESMPPEQSGYPSPERTWP
jgi:outer membrane protein